MKRQANHSVLKSTGATVLSPGPRVFGAPEQKASAGASIPGSSTEDVRAPSGKENRPERRERSGSVSRAPLGKGTDSVPLSGLKDPEDLKQGGSRPPRGRSNSGSQPATAASAAVEQTAASKAPVASEAPTRARGSKGSKEVPASSPSLASESGRRGRRPSREQQEKALDDELEALLKGVEEPVPAASAAKEPVKEPPKEPPKEPATSATALAQATPVPGQERCTVCGTQFQNGQSIYESSVAGQKQVLCSGCWSQVAPHCIACGKLISGPMAKVGDDVYHQECLKCAICSKTIDGALSKLDCGICCGACTDEVDKDLRELRKLWQAGDLEGAALLEGSLKARGIKPPELKRPDLGHCSSCQLPFRPGQQVYQKDQDSKMVCEACYLSAAPCCAVCSKPVVGTVAKVGDNSYHPECLVCSSCAKQIAGSFAKTEKGFVCAECQATSAS